MHAILSPDALEARAKAYRLLSALYYPPDENAGDTLDSLVELWGAHQPDLLPLVADMQEEADPQSLVLVYTPLFLGPFKVLASPYGSVYLEEKREVMGASTQEVARLYQQAGLELSAASREVPDHIAIELEFMYYLIYRQGEALAGDDPASATVWLERQSDFLHRHLGHWIGQFAQAVRAHTSAGSFYGNLAEVTLSFVERDYRIVCGYPSQSQQQHQPAS